MALSISHLGVFLGEGAFSWVYSLKEHPYAAKISKFDGQDFLKELRLLQELHSHNQQLFPKAIATGALQTEQQQATSPNRKYMLMERLGTSLQELLALRRTLSLSTITQIGRQLLAQLSVLSSKGIVHNDIKPANVLFGLAERRKQVFLVDYGLADSSSSPKCHIFRGNLPFSASRKLRGEYGHDLRNDLQSFIYILLWLLRDGSLPWQQQEGKEEPVGRRAIQILSKRQQFIDSTLQSTKQSHDKRATLICKLVSLLGQEGMGASELLSALQGVMCISI